jgi:uncharacterized protein (TIGR02217 family)
MSSIDERLDDDIEAGAKRRPRYSTDIVTADGGWEVRNERWAYPLFSYDFNFMPGDRRDGEILEEITDHFHVVGGRAGTFPFRDWNDYHALAQVLGTGDGSTVHFQLYRNYTRGAITRRRLITRPVADTIVIRVNGVVAGFTHIGKGLIQLNSAAPNGQVVDADFDFDVLVRFESDELEYVSISGDIEQITTVTLVEVREEPEEAP